MNAEFTLAETDCTEPIDTTCVYSEGYLYASFTVTRAARAHSGNATCSTPDTCDYCGITYEMPDNHAYEWKNDNGNHWQECSYNSNHKTNRGICGGGYATCAVSGTCATCGGSYKDTQAHDYIYTANDNTITEICKNDCGHSATATLTATDATYTGAAITTGASVTYSDGWGGSQEHGEITYSNNLNAGTATAKVTFEGKELTTTFEINEADISDAVVTLNPTSGTYTGTAYDPSVSVTLDGFGTLAEGTDYTLSWDKTGFTNADTYTVTVTGKGNFKGTKTQFFTINAAELSDIKVEQVGTLTYTDEAQTPTVSASATSVDGSEITFTYSTESEGPYSTEIPSFTNAGWAHTVYYRATADNHNTYYGSFLVEIEKATVTEPTIASKPYNGSTQTADITDTELYTVVKNDGGEGVKQSGYYDVVLELKDPANYTWSSTDNTQLTLPFAITRAENEWTVTPSVTGWTYGKPAGEPVGEARFGDISVEYSGTTNAGESFSGTYAPTEAGNYTATFIVQETEDYRGLEASADFTVAKANYNMAGARWVYSAPFRYDGKEHTVELTGLPAGVTVESYENNTAAAVGDYYARAKLAYDAHNYNAPAVHVLGWTIYNDWTPAEYTVNGSGWMNKDFVISANDGYKISLTNTADGEWKDALTYSAETADGSVSFYLKDETDGAISLGKTVSYKLDTTAPTGVVEFVERSSWEEFVHTITFGLFYKDEVTVKITGADNLSGVAKIEYYASGEAMSLAAVESITDWTEYNGEFGVALEDTKQFVYFVRITDNAGNVTLLSTDGAEYDTTAPVIEGIENGKTYYTTQRFQVQERNLDSVTVNGNPSMTFALGGNVDKEYVIVATDTAGNTTTVTVTMKPIQELAKATENLGPDNVTSADAPALEELIENLEELIADPDTSSDGEMETLEQHKSIAESLLQTIEDAAKAADTENTQKVTDVTPENVTREDKTDLEKAQADLEKALEDNGGNYTEEEKSAIEDALERIDDALTVIGNAEAVEDLIHQLPENITKSDEDAIEKADDAYNALTDYEKSLVDGDAKQALDDAKAALAALNKPVDPDYPPATGDDSNLLLWFSLLFASGMGIFGLALHGRKRKQ